MRTLVVLVVVLVLGVLVLGCVACGPTVNGRTGDGGGGNGDCDPGFADCDGLADNGCEANLSDVNSCGACGTVCGGDHASSVTCAGGACNASCEPGYGECNGLPADGCETPTNTSTDCGTCGVRCAGPNAVGMCVNSMCEVTCAAGYGDCNDDLADGCESELTTQQACGACGVSCTGACLGSTCETCDGALALASNDPLDAARAIGLCAGVVSARWALPDGTDAPMNPNFDLGHGLMSGFGTNVTPREGGKLLGLSSGTARQPSDPGYMTPSGFDKGYTANHPMGFPKESPACPGVTTGPPHDAIALEVTLTVPDWANGFAFDFDFYTYEWPGYVCSTYNDFFVAILSPVPMGLPDGNISFDAMGNPISVNNAFVSVCGCLGGPPCQAGGKTFTCPAGNAELLNTGFQEMIGPFAQDHAATSWLTTSAPATPGSTITLLFGIYDSGDGVLDSTTLVDNFRWLPVPPDVGTEPIP